VTADRWATESRARAFQADLDAKPEALARLAVELPRDSVIPTLPLAPRRIVLLGMGSSGYVAGIAAGRLRAAGLDAVSELASAAVGTPAARDTLVLAISATGGSIETLAAVERHRGRSRVVAVTNTPASPLAQVCDAVIELHAGPEVSGVACRTFQHTLLTLRAIEAQLTGLRLDVAELCSRVAAATADLFALRPAWLPEVAAALDGRDGVHALAPAERLSSALQSALMVREGPRRPGTGSETGEWAHVDVYLARTLDYRALLYAGSRWDAQAMEWLTLRGSTVVAVGGDVPGAAVALRYAGDDDPDVAVATETLMAELGRGTLVGRSRGTVARWTADVLRTSNSLCGPRRHLPSPPPRRHAAMSERPCHLPGDHGARPGLRAVTAHGRMPLTASQRGAVAPLPAVDPSP